MEALWRKAECQSFLALETVHLRVREASLCSSLLACLRRVSATSQSGFHHWVLLGCGVVRCSKRALDAWSISSIRAEAAESREGMSVATHYIYRQ